MTNMHTTFLHKTEGRSQSGPSRADDDGVVLVVDDGVLARDVLVHLRRAFARRAPEAPGARGGNGPANATLTEFLGILLCSLQ